MNASVIAKLKVQTFIRHEGGEDLEMSIVPALFGKFKPGQKFYVDFTEAQ